MRRLSWFGLMGLVLAVVCVDSGSAQAATPARLASARLSADPCCPEPCCPKPCITYRTRGCDRCCDPCAPKIQTVLQVIDPCTCCPIDVPVCLPACCEGEPTRSCGRGLLGRNVVWYDWCCGYSVKVTFQRCGDLIVTYVAR